MIVKWENTKYALYAKIYPFDDNDFYYIVAQRNRDVMGNTFYSAMVNTPSIGELSEEEAGQWANGFLRAAEIAKEMNGDIHTYSVDVILKDMTNHTSIILANNMRQVFLSIQNNVHSIVHVKQLE